MGNTNSRELGMTLSYDAHSIEAPGGFPAYLPTHYRYSRLTNVDTDEVGGDFANLQSRDLVSHDEIAVAAILQHTDLDAEVVAPDGEGTHGNAGVPGGNFRHEANGLDETLLEDVTVDQYRDRVGIVPRSRTRDVLASVISAISSWLILLFAEITDWFDSVTTESNLSWSAAVASMRDYARAIGMALGEWARNDPDLDIPEKIPVDLRVFKFVHMQVARSGYKVYTVSEKADVLSKTYNNFVSAARTNGVGELYVPWDERAPIRCVEVAVAAVKWQLGQLERRSHYGRLSTKVLSHVELIYSLFAIWHLLWITHTWRRWGCYFILHCIIHVLLWIIFRIVDGAWLAYRCRLEEFNLPKACWLHGLILVGSKGMVPIVEKVTKPDIKPAVAQAEDLKTDENPAQQAAALADSKETEDRTSGNREDPVEDNIDSLNLITEIKCTENFQMHPATDHALHASTGVNHQGESSKVEVIRPPPIPIDTSDVTWALATVDAVEEAVGDISQSVDLGSSFLKRTGPGKLLKRDTRLKADMSVVRGSTSIIENARGKLKAEDTAAYFHVGPGWAQNIPIVFGKSAHNELVALTTRHMNVYHSPEDPSVARWKVLTPKFLRLLADEYFPLVDDPMSLEEWLTTQPLIKAERYRKDLMDGKLASAMNKEFAGDHYRQSFLKDELRLQELGKVGADLKPRLIQGLAEPFIQMYLGWLTKSIAYNFRKNFLRKADTERQTIFSMSSYTNDDGIGEWYHTYKDAGWHFFENDFSSFDSTQGHGCAILESSVFEMFCNHWVKRMSGKEKQTTLEYAALGLHQQALKFQMRTKGRTAFYNYSCYATRKSGDPNTSIGNSLINMCSNAYAIADYLGRIKDYGTCDLKKDLRVMVNGDDCLLAIHPRYKLSDLEGLTDYVPLYMEALGLKSKFKYSGNRPTYCSRIFVPINLSTNGPEGVIVKETYGLAIDIPKYVSKCGFTVNHLNRGETVADRTLSGLKSVSGAEWMPVYKHLLSVYGEVTGKHAEVLDIVRHHQVSGSRVIRDYEWALEYYGVGRGDLEALGLHIAKGVKACRGEPFYYSSDTLRRMWEYSQRPAEIITRERELPTFSEKECSFATRDGGSVTREPVKEGGSSSKRDPRTKPTQDSRQKKPVKDNEKESAQPLSNRSSRGDDDGSVSRRAVPTDSRRSRDAKRGKTGNSNSHNQLQHTKRHNRVHNGGGKPSGVSALPTL